MDGLRHAQIDTQLGELVVVAEGPALTGIYFPGHRVVGSDGSPTGYAGGLERKQHLLELEDPVMAESRLF